MLLVAKEEEGGEVEASGSHGTVLVVIKPTADNAAAASARAFDKIERGDLGGDTDFIAAALAVEGSVNVAAVGDLRGTDDDDPIDLKER